MSSTVGSIVEPEWWEDNNFCGNGIHLCPSPQHARDHFPDAKRFLEVTCDAATFIPIDTSKIKTAQAYVLHPTQGGQVNSTDYDGPDTYEEDIDAAMKARIKEDRWSQ